MGMRPDFFRGFIDPPGVVIQDERATYQRRLNVARERQLERDMIAEALIENGFHGVPYKSMEEEYPWLREALGL
jgi:hypothetical protein